MEKDERILSNVKKLRKGFTNLSKEKKDLAYKLIDEIAFMQVTIEELRQSINIEGAIIEGVNGNGFETKTEHPAQKSYNTIIKNYLSSIKQLNELLPDSKSDGAAKAGEALKDFIRAGKK